MGFERTAVPGDIRIDPDTGDIVLGVHRIGRHTKVRELWAIDPAHFERSAADDDNFFCRFADLEITGQWADHRIGCQSYHREGSVLTYTLMPYVPGEGWDDLSDATEARKVALLETILAASGITNHHDFGNLDFDWGHLVAGYDGRSGITALTVAYYRRVRG